MKMRVVSSHAQLRQRLDEDKDSATSGTLVDHVVQTVTAVTEDGTGQITFDTDEDFVVGDDWIVVAIHRKT